MSRPPSLIQVANKHLPFPTAARWAGLDFYGEASDRGTKVHCPSGEFEHPDGGREPALRIYPDHGWCFAENRYFSPVSLLAEVWGVSQQDAAARALDKAGYKPSTYASAWEAAIQPRRPDVNLLGKALNAFCEGICPDWRQRQYDKVVAAKHSECLGLLSMVSDERQAEVWLSASKQVMGALLAE